MKRLREFHEVIQYVMSKELSWYEGYVTSSVSEEYRKGFMAGIKAMKNLIADIYARFITESYP